MRVDLDLAGHERRLGFDGEEEHVLNVAGVDGDVEADVAARHAGGVDDRTLGKDVGLEEPSVDGLEIGVAVGAVDDGVEFGVEGHGAFGDVETEVRGSGCAVDEDSAELTLVVAVGRENAADAFDGAEVGVAEGVLSADGGVAGAVGVEGAEVSGGVDVAGGAGVGEDGVELHGAAGADGVEADFPDDEVEGDLAGLAVFDDEAGAFDVDFADENFDLAVALVLAGFLGGLPGLVLAPVDAGTLIFGREVDVEAGDLDAIDVHGGAEELTPVEGVE